MEEQLATYTMQN